MKNFLIGEVYKNGIYKIIDNEGVRVGHINVKFLRPYYSRCIGTYKATKHALKLLSSNRVGPSLSSNHVGPARLARPVAIF